MNLGKIHERVGVPAGRTVVAKGTVNFLPQALVHPTAFLSVAKSCPCFRRILCVDFVGGLFGTLLPRFRVKSHECRAHLFLTAKINAHYRIEKGRQDHQGCVRVERSRVHCV